MSRDTHTELSTTPNGAPARTELAPGDTLGGFPLLEVAGRGGMGVVFRAHDRTLDRVVAVKVLPWAAAEPFRSWFRTEACMAAALDHPHIVPVYAWGEDGETVFMVMRYVDGADLRSVVAGNGPLAPERAVRLLRQVASALDAAHAPEHGLIHRDVKPQNLLLAHPGTEAEHLYLTDFGLAYSTVRAPEGADSKEFVGGTHAYMSPEQVGGEDLDARSDLYALAAVAMFLLTGSPPFMGATSQETAMAHLRDEPPRASVRRPDLPVAVDEVLAAGLAKAREARPDSCRDFVAMLERALTEGGTAAGSGTRLPIALSSFVGRADDLLSVRARLAQHRLVTLTGPGGVGKSRLALAAVDGWSGAADPVLVELAGVSDDTAVINTLTTALGAVVRGTETAEDAVVRTIGDRRRLVVIDNCEHVLDIVAVLVPLLLGTCRGLTVLATSRVPLDVAGEGVLPVWPLPVPTPGSDPADLADSAAVQLFAARAASAGTAVNLAGDEGTAVGAICRQLDGIPLAIELAARRTRSMSPAQIATGLGDTLSLLTGGGRHVAERQRTMAATLAWSYDLLGAEERIAFRWLSVFAGGLDLAAAEAVLGEAALAAGAIPDLIASLVDWSLLARDPDQPGRYRMLETARAFGVSALGDDEAAARNAHLRWCTELVEAAWAGQNAPEEERWAARVDREIDNVRAALRFAADDAARAAEMLRLAASFAALMSRRVAGPEACTWAEAALHSAGTDAEAQHRLLAWRAVATGAADHGELSRAAELATNALTEYQDVDDHDGVFACRNLLGRVATHHDDVPVATQHFEAALSAARSAGNANQQGWALSNLADLVAAENPGRARDLLTEALHLTRRADNDPGEAWTLSNLGLVAMLCGDAVEACQHLQAAESVQTRGGDQQCLGATLHYLGVALLQLDEVTNAQIRLREALRVALDGGHLPLMLTILIGVADICSATGRHEDAARLDGLVRATREEFGLLRGDPVEAFHPAWTDVSAAALGPTRFESARRAGRALNLDAVIAGVLAENPS